MNTISLLLPSWQHQQGDEEARKPAAASFFVQRIKSELRFKFLMAGWMLGSIVELLQIVKQVEQHGQLGLMMTTKTMEKSASTTVKDAEDATSDGATMTILASGGDGETHDKNATIQQQGVLSFLSGIVWYQELPYLCSVVFVAVYIFLLVRHVRKAILLATARTTANSNDITPPTLPKNTHEARIRSHIGWEHAVAASNFLTGRLLGALATFVLVVGPSAAWVPLKLLQMILTIFAGTAWCFFIKCTMIHFFLMGTSWNGDDHEEEEIESSSRHQKEQQHQQHDEEPQEQQQGPSYHVAHIV